MQIMSLHEHVEKSNIATKLLYHTLTFPKLARAVWPTKPFGNYLKYLLHLWIDGKTTYGNQASTPHPDISKTGLGSVTSQPFSELFEICVAFVDQWNSGLGFANGIKV